MEPANFIPLGSVKGRLPFDQPEKDTKSGANLGATKEDRKRIAREVRLAARKEKKETKSDAKKQRKENAVLNRRMIRNNAEIVVAESQPEVKSKTKKRSNSEISNSEDKPATSDEPKSKKGKKHSSSKDVKTDQASEAAETASNKKAKEVTSKPAPTSNHDPLPAPEAIQKIVQKEKERAKKSKKREEKLAKAMEEAEKLKPKKRKRSQEEVGPADDVKPEKAPKKKKIKADKAKLERPEAQADEPAAAPAKHTSSAEQWNPDALTGDEARKAKFLRLLGAGKSDGATSSSSKRKSHTDSAAISNVQSELERQYEAGMKLKHDGGSKRRGIGA